MRKKKRQIHINIRVSRIINKKWHSTRKEKTDKIINKLKIIIRRDSDFRSLTMSVRKGQKYELKNIEAEENN